jgi:hypothetical protein
MAMFCAVVVGHWLALFGIQSVNLLCLLVWIVSLSAYDT